MDISTEQALALLNKYCSEKIRVKVTFLARSGIVAASVAGLIGSIPPSHICVKSELDASDFIYFPVTNCRYAYGDTREAPEYLKETMKERYESALTVLFPPFDDIDKSERLYIFELRMDRDYNTFRRTLNSQAELLLASDLL